MSILWTLGVHFIDTRHKWVNLLIFQPGNLLKAEVGIGNVETVIKSDRTRTAPSSGYDSIIVSLSVCLEIYI